MGYDVKTIRKDFKRQGVFYTPSELASRLKGFVDVPNKNVYGPTCGNRGLLSYLMNKYVNNSFANIEKTVFYCCQYFKDTFLRAIHNGVHNLPPLIGFPARKHDKEKKRKVNIYIRKPRLIFLGALKNQTNDRAHLSSNLPGAAVCRRPKGRVLFFLAGCHIRSVHAGTGGMPGNKPMAEQYRVRQAVPRPVQFSEQRADCQKATKSQAGCVQKKL